MGSQESKAAMRPFEWHRIAKTERAKALVAAVLSTLSGLEEGRVRSRKSADQQRYELQVEALISDAVVAHLKAPASWLLVSRSKRVLDDTANNYKPPYITKKLTQVMDMLARADVGLLSVEVGKYSPNHFSPNAPQGMQTQIKAAARLIELIDFYSLEPSDFGLHESQEVIILKSPKDPDDHWSRGRKMTYADTPDTLRMREEVRHINRWLDTADIFFDSFRDGDNLIDPDISQRRLRRVFIKGSWDYYGRLQGAFWIDMKGDHRLGGISIDGEPVADLDYGQMNPRLLYADAGIVPDFDDAYAIPGLENHREGVKKLLNSLIASNSKLTRFPKGVNKMISGMIEIDGQMVVTRCDTVVGLISDFHRPVSHLFCKGLGTRLMRLESDIMVKVLLSLIEDGITALPIHDGLLVAESKAQRAKAVMLEVFREMTGAVGVVSIR